MKAGFYDDGYAVYPHDPAILKWVEAAKPLATEALNDQTLLDTWLLCEGTWFVGVDALMTGPDGQAGDVPLAGQVISDLQTEYCVQRPMHKAQLSVVYPGYPKPREGESEGAFNYRRKRDAAHVDGLHAVGPNRHRHLSEHHAYLLGLPITRASEGASPLVIWQGSHKIVQSWLSEELSALPEKQWKDINLTDGYMSIRRKVFDTCERVEVPVQPGEAVVMHRHAVHGIAPWKDNTETNSGGRMIAYFRPEMALSLRDWLNLR
ncbi:MAG: hypothetical protein P8L68_12895 [Paracoccaceae bacterium]|nr:hypothetical protein [Paracoccaceae bacterium]MDG1738804.1 hypothetical protein [Paracoccaceae bacterium]MDG2259381.1 hypothetical protein [Paracoccaceae bacterium]